MIEFAKKMQFSYFLLTTCSIQLVLLLRSFGLCDNDSNIHDLKTRRIIGGELTPIERYPFAAFLMIGKTTCGGSIITSRIILTAAHCFGLNHTAGHSDEKGLAFLGHENPRLSNQILRIQETLIHKKYSMFEYDIALAFLDDFVRFSNSVKKVVLSAKPYPPNTVGKVAGWDLISLKPRPLKELRLLKRISMPIQNPSVCIRVYPNISDRTLCVGKHKSKQTTFKGDSGSPFVIAGSVQIGIVSYGRYWITALRVFSSIARFYSWIEEGSSLLHEKNCIALEI